jgi:hypothetical protein
VRPRRYDLEVVDAQVHPFGAGVFDVVLSNFGVMFFDDPAAAFGAFSLADVGRVGALLSGAGSAASSAPAQAGELTRQVRDRPRNQRIDDSTHSCVLVSTGQSDVVEDSRDFGLIVSH